MTPNQELKIRRRLKDYIDKCKLSNVLEIADQVEKKTGLIIIER
jgi:hypothetical protein